MRESAPEFDLAGIASRGGQMGKQAILRDCARLAPPAFPLWADRISHSVGKDDPAEVLARMLQEFENAAARGLGKHEIPLDAARVGKINSRTVRAVIFPNPPFWPPGVF